MKGAKYDMMVVNDPSGIFKKGARIPFQEFLVGLVEGCFAEGMTISKRAVTSEFTVGKTDGVGLVLFDDRQNKWKPLKKGKYQLCNLSWR